MPPDERPYEKCLSFGPEILSDSELLAVILKTGTIGRSSIDVSRDILRLHDGSHSLVALHKKSIEELMLINGIGKVKAITLKCIAEMAKRMGRISCDVTKSFNRPSQIAVLFMDEMRYLGHEEVRLLCLNGANRYIADEVLTSGTVDQSPVSTRDIFMSAIRHSAVNIVLLHNHPGGDPTPSENDILVTKKVREAGELMDIKLLDHIIIGSDSYVSMKDNGML
ncbi:MAG: DNA repair protein RadC [Lachnospiraceae bacterium]|nr:DNA repair protein RadC [Lachnospiraceae bacterium]